jgi:hypothetical protein
MRRGEPKEASEKASKTRAFGLIAAVIGADPIKFKFFWPGTTRVSLGLQQKVV